MTKRTVVALFLVMSVCAVATYYVVVTSSSKSLHESDTRVNFEEPTAESESGAKQSPQDRDESVSFPKEGEIGREQGGETSEHNRDVTQENSTETEFIEIGSLKGRQDIDYEGIEHLSSAEVLAGFLEGIEAGDEMWLNIGESILRDRAQGDNGEAVSLLVAAIEKEERISTKEYLVGMLGSFGTTHAVKALLEMASSDDPNVRVVRDSIWYAIENIPAQDHNKYNSYREELSPILEMALEGSKSEPAFYSAVIKALARIGSQNGTELLLQEWRQARSEEDRMVVETALMSITNPQAVPVLEQALQEDANLLTGIGDVAGGALSAMGDRDATLVILKWASRTEGARLRAKAIAWLSDAATSAQAFEVIREAGQLYEFRDTTTKEEIEKLTQMIEQKRKDIRIQ